MAIANSTIVLALAAFLAWCFLRLVSAGLSGKPHYWCVYFTNNRARSEFFLDPDHAVERAKQTGGVVHDAQNRIWFDPASREIARLTDDDLWPLASEQFSDCMGDVQAAH